MEGETILHEWKYGIIGPVKKKEDTMMCDIYRAITLLCATYKILANISYVKLISYAEEILGKDEGGFRRGRSSVDQIFPMGQILEKCWEKSIGVNDLFIGFQAAYDSVWRKEIWSEMR